MSTKNIEEALKSLDDMWGTRDTEIGKAARAELEAIRKAAAFVVRESAITDVENEHVDLICAIAKEGS